MKPTGSLCRDWGSIFGDSMIATAILDRLLHHSTTVSIRGASYRLKDHRKAGLVLPRGQEGAEAAASFPSMKLGGGEFSTGTMGIFNQN
jgi:hypothetical protein